MVNQIVAIHTKAKSGLKRDTYTGIIENRENGNILLRLLGEYTTVKTGPNKGAKRSDYRTIKESKVLEMEVVGRE